MANERAMPADPTLSDRNPRRRRYRKGQEICQEDQFQRQRRTLEGNRSKRERGYQGDTYLPDYHETMVHYNKSFGVLQELFDHRDFVGFVEELHGCTVAAAALSGEAPCPRFLDLGCAPGGFSGCLLQDHILGPMSVGYGVSLPPQLGGFQMVINTQRLCVQFEDLLQVEACELLCMDNSIDICVADAQYLSNMFKPQHQAAKYRGTKVRSRTLGIWALTVKECLLAFSKLRHSGSFVFRFGWRGVGSADVHPSGEKVHPNLLAKYLQEEEWYTALTHWLFSVLKSLFSTMRPFKSEYVHQADVSFYMVCRSFDREKFEMHNWEAKLQRAYDEITNCQDEALLVAGLKEALNQGVKAEIDELLEYVGRMRAIGIQSRKVTNPKAFSWAKSGDEKSEKEKSNPKEDPSLPEPESQEKLSTEKVQVTNPKSDASTELEERSESSSAATQASETSTGPAPKSSAQTARRKQAAEGESKAAAQPAKAAVHEFRDTAPRPVDKGEFSSNWTHRQDRQQPSADAWAGQCLPAGDAWSVPWSEVHPLVAELEWTEEAYQPEAFYPAYPAMPNSHVHLMEMDGVCMDAMAGHGSMLSEDGCMLQADGMAFADDGMAVHHGALMPEDACMLQGDTMPGHMMHMDECMMMQDWPHSMVSGSFHVQALPPPPPPAPPPPLAPREEAVATFLAGRPPSAQVLATTMNTSGHAVGSSSPVVAEPTEEPSPDMQRQRPPTSSEQEALEAMNVSEEEGEDETNLRRRRHKKRRDKDRPGRRGKSDVLRAIRLMQREGRAPARPWHQRMQEALRSAILDMHQDSLQALRFGICFAMCWSLCSLVMSLIRFSSQYGGDVGDLTATQGGAGR